MATAQKTRRKSARKPERAASQKPRPAADPDRALGDDGDPQEPGRSSAAVAEIDAEALEFIEALDRFKKQHGRPFPSWSEVLFVLKELGYRKR